jgi:hypothetical protein
MREAVQSFHSSGNTEIFLEHDKARQLGRKPALARDPELLREVSSNMCYRFNFHSSIKGHKYRIFY